MSAGYRRCFLTGGAILLWGAALVVTAARPQDGRGPAPARVNYETQIRPLIVENCLSCHNQDKRSGGLSLATYADILEGGKDGPVVKPGKSADSRLIHRLTGEIAPQMPQDAIALDTTTIVLFRRWIDEGARLSPTSPPAPAPWEAPLALTTPVVPAAVWPAWNAPADRIVAAYLRDHRSAEPRLVSDAVFARRVYLDLWGLLPPPAELQAFVADRSPIKRAALVQRLLGDNDLYAEHWISFWNDLLRNEDGVTYFSDAAGGARRSITPWLLPALQDNMSYDRFVSELLSPAPASGPEGFLIGVNWRGETSAAVTPWMQASQNTAQLFLGINLKCNSCHDSFVNRWKLKEAYGLASYFAPEGRLQLFRCDVAQDQYAEPSFLFPALNRPPASSALADRRAAAAAIFTDPRNGRLPRTIVNRLWQRLIGQGIVANADEMDGRPWSPVLLDWLASDFVEHQYDLKHLIATIVLSRAYQMPTVTRTHEPPAAGYVFGGPEARRLTAEQFADAIGSITGEWSVSTLNITVGRGAAPTGAGVGAPAAGRGAAAEPPPTDPPTVGRYVREWRNMSTDMTRALGRPIRDQVTSVRATQPTTPQALELANGELLTRWVLFGARRMLGVQGPEPLSLYNKSVAGRGARPVSFEIDISGASRLWLLVRDQGSNTPALVQPVWAQAEFVIADGTATPLGALRPVDSGGLRTGTGPIALNGAQVQALRVTNPSTLTYDIAGRGFTRLRGTLWIENPVADVGSILDPQLRFYVFSSEPNMDRLRPPVPGRPLPLAPPIGSATAVVDRVFRYLLGRAPSPAERQAAENAVQAPQRPGHPSPEGLAELLWAVLMMPEFQFIY